MAIVRFTPRSCVTLGRLKDEQAVPVLTDLRAAAHRSLAIGRIRGAGRDAGESAAAAVMELLRDRSLDVRLGEDSSRRRTRQTDERSRRC